MKTFKVTVDGQIYTVNVEEIKTDSSPVIAEKVADSPVEKPDPVIQTQTTAAAAPSAAKPKAEPSAPKQAQGGSMSIKAPMPGSVLEVKVKEGDTVKEGDVLLVLEAMKMENELTASQAGTVTQIFIKKGDTVNSGDPLITLS